MTVTIKVEIDESYYPNVVARDMKEAAAKLGLPVVGEYRGGRMRADGWESTESILQAWEETGGKE